MKSSLGLLLVTLVVAGCASLSRREKPPAPAAGSSTVEGLAAAISADARRSEQEPDSRVRTELASRANGEADACLALDPHAVACLYGKALALGLDARAHPARATQTLGSMLDALNGAEAADPNYDQAGPARVRALVLIRAPGWPLGPGDVDAGLVAARRAVALHPEYPPNVLVLAESLAKTGDGAGARENYARARELAQAMPASADRDSWLREANEGLQRR